jgi:hypothetical protein
VFPIGSPELQAQAIITDSLRDIARNIGAAQSKIDAFNDERLSGVGCTADYS